MFVAFWMVQRLTCEINRLEMEELRKTQELSYYQKYAGILGGSSIMNISNVAGLPSYLIPRATLFAQYSDQASSMSAMQNLQMMKMTGRVPYTGNPMVQMQLEMSAYNQFKQQALKQLKEQEAAVLNEKEKEIQLELNEIRQQLTTKRESLKACKELASEQARDSAVKFSLS